jgi:hypothetical protein
MQVGQDQPDGQDEFARRAVEPSPSVASRRANLKVSLAFTSQARSSVQSFYPPASEPPSAIASFSKLI